MTNVEIFKQIFETYNISNPLPLDTKKYMLKSKKKILIIILKKKGNYGVIISIVISFFLFVKYIGFSISMAKAFFLTILILSVSTLTITASSIYIADKYIFRGDKPEIIPQIKEKEKIIPEIDAKTESKKSVSKIIDYKILIIPFKYSLENSLAKSITNKIIKEFTLLKGKNSIALFNNSTQRRSKKLLIGSINRIGTIYNISAKIADKDSSRILYFISEKANSREDISRACRELARKIAKKI